MKIIQHAGGWLHEQGLNESDLWDPAVLSRKFFSDYAKPSEFYVVTADDKPAAAAIL